MSSENLTHRQRAAIEELLYGKRFEDVAQKIGVNPKTISRWWNNPHFRVTYLLLQTARIDYALLPLLEAIPQAIEALIDVMEQPQQLGASNKRLAAVAIIEQVQKMRETNQEKRITELEVQVYGQQTN